MNFWKDATKVLVLIDVFSNSELKASFRQSLFNPCNAKKGIERDMLFQLLGIKNWCQDSAQRVISIYGRGKWTLVKYEKSYENWWEVAWKLKFKGRERVWMYLVCSLKNANLRGMTQR